MTCRKNSEQENQNRTEPKMLKEEAFRQSNVVCIGILSLLIVKANDLAFFKWQKGIFS